MEIVTLALQTAKHAQLVLAQLVNQVSFSSLNLTKQ